MHFVAPEWSQDFPVSFHCGIPVNYMKSPAKIFRTCKQVHALDPAVCNAWREEILHLILDLDSFSVNSDLHHSLFHLREKAPRAID